MEPVDQADVLGLLDVRVTITGPPVPKPKIGPSCSLAEWFEEHERLVPYQLTDEAWALIEPTVKAWEPEHSNRRLIPSRRMIDAMFHKARAGCRWQDLPERFGLRKSIHSRHKRWRTEGIWDQIMSALLNEDQPLWVQPLVPPFRVEGRVDPSAS
ncbi:transposase [Streptomyces cyaneofuscatus]|uniref:transposase n=1 Tax=Streptomyces cyaneofuscatus TaxID=66883 RepID=UPI0036D1454A